MYFHVSKVVGAVVQKRAVRGDIHTLLQNDQLPVCLSICVLQQQQKGRFFERMMILMMMTMMMITPVKYSDMLKV